MGAKPDSKHTPLTDTAIYEVPVDALTPYPGNPRVGNTEAIAESLKANGQYRPIIVRRETREILAGNHTWRAARALRWDTIKVTYLDNLTDQQAAKIVLADNRLPDLGRYNTPDLTALIEQVSGDLTGTGYDPYFVQNLLTSLDSIETIPIAQQNETPVSQDDEQTEPASVEVQETPAPEPPKDPITKPGDVWLLGDHRVICGDSTKFETYAALMNTGEQADTVITDPPYNIAYVGQTDDALTISNDDMSEEQFEKFLESVFAPMYLNTREGGAVYLFHDGLDPAGVHRRTLTAAGFLYKQALIWVKDRLVLSRQDYHWQHEAILYGWKPGAAHYWNLDRKQKTVIDEQPNFSEMDKEELIELLTEMYSSSTIIREPRPQRNSEHPTMKPVSLIRRLVVANTTYDQIVLDPFGGSGSTLMAAHDAKRVARLIELDPSYVDVICRRFQQHTGITPVLESTGERHDFVGE